MTTSTVLSRHLSGRPVEHNGNLGWPEVPQKYHLCTSHTRVRLIALSQTSKYEEISVILICIISDESKWTYNSDSVQRPLMETAYEAVSFILS